MKQIRRNVFETNSSSTHSIAIPNEKMSNYSSVIHFGFGEFGWSFDEVNPADYLYTAIYAFYEDEDIRKEKIDIIKRVLDENNIRYTFEEPTINSWGDIQGYIDHSYELGDFLNDVFANDSNLLNFIFDGIVLTGNDNSYANGFLDRMLETYEEWVSSEDKHWTTIQVKNPYYDKKYKNYTWYYKGN